MLSVFDHLALHPFLAELPAEDLHRLSRRARRVMWPVNRRLFRAGGPAERFWLLHAGEVVLDMDIPGRGDVVIERIRAGSVLGWSWLLPPRRWATGAVAGEVCQAIEFDANCVRALMARDDRLARDLSTRFLAVVAGRLQADRRRLVELYSPISLRAEADRR